jgi:hypothetical protein
VGVGNKPKQSCPTDTEFWADMQVRLHATFLYCLPCLLYCLLSVFVVGFSSLGTALEQGFMLLLRRCCVVSACAAALQLFVERFSSAQNAVMQEAHTDRFAHSYEHCLVVAFAAAALTAALQLFVERFSGAQKAVMQEEKDAAERKQRLARAEAKKAAAEAAKKVGFIIMFGVFCTRGRCFACRHQLACSGNLNRNVCFVEYGSSLDEGCGAGGGTAGRLFDLRFYSFAVPASLVLQIASSQQQQPQVMCRCTP